MSQPTFTARKIASIADASTACLVLPMFDDLSLSKELAKLDKRLAGTLSRALELGDFSGAPGTSLTLLGDKKIQRVLLVGCGAVKKFDAENQKKAATAIGRSVAAGKAREALLYFGDLSVEAEGLHRLIEAVATEILHACYVYTQTLSKPKNLPNLAKVNVCAGALITTAKVRAALDAGAAIGGGVNFTRELGNLPANICTPTYLAKQARALARKHPNLSVSVLNEKKMRELGMGSLLSVGHGSDQPSQLIVLEYKGGKAKEAPYALVGKGITFDTGGISLKPGGKMDEMKFDMGGASSVLGTVKAVADLNLPINVVGVVAAAENMPSGRATKPGDVVTSMSGQTIEILNTDAEGRLVLCDALTYVGRYKPREVVDIATLTGAIIVSLGHEACGIFANDDDLAEALLSAGQRSQDRGWRMPIWQEYQKQLDSKFADMQNIGTGTAGSVTAACFLARFTEQYKWAHLDVAGTAFRSAPKGATGRPVPMLVEYLRGRAGQ
ncbi:MAG: leucyl aminopeptidase [Luminiphilus sp.]|nr:leucyl aminopeptidase [Luminiphilus sp.]